MPTIDGLIFFVRMASGALFGLMAAFVVLTDIPLRFGWALAVFFLSFTAFAGIFVGSPANSSWATLGKAFYPFGGSRERRNKQSALLDALSLTYLVLMVLWLAVALIARAHIDIVSAIPIESFIVDMLIGASWFGIVGLILAALSFLARFIGQ